MSSTCQHKVCYQWHEVCSVGDQLVAAASRQSVSLVQSPDEVMFTSGCVCVCVCVCLL